MFYTYNLFGSDLYFLYKIPYCFKLYSCLQAFCKPVFTQGLFLGTTVLERIVEQIFFSIHLHEYVDEYHLLQILCSCQSIYLHI